MHALRVHISISLCSKIVYYAIICHYRENHWNTIFFFLSSDFSLSKHFTGNAVHTLSINTHIYTLSR